MSQAGFFFYTGDWIKDTRMLSAECRGCWIDALCFLNEHGGSVTWPLSAYARYWGLVDNQARDVLDAIAMANVGNVQWQNDSKTIAKLSNRRMVRLAEHEEHNRQHIHEVRSKAGKKGLQKRWQSHSKNSNLPSPSPSLNLKIKIPAENAGVVDKSEPAEIKDELIKTAIRLAGTSQKNQYKLCQWVLSMFSTLRREPRERIEAAVKSSLAALEAELTKGKPINDLWAYLTVIFDKERTKYIQGPENDAYKRQSVGKLGDIVDKIAAQGSKA